MATLNIKNFPDGLHRRLQARAKLHRRSVAQEVTHILATVVDAAAAPRAARSAQVRSTEVETDSPVPDAGGYMGRDSGWD